MRSKHYAFWLPTQRLAKQTPKGSLILNSNRWLLSEHCNGSIKRKNLAKIKFQAVLVFIQNTDTNCNMK